MAPYRHRCAPGHRKSCGLREDEAASHLGRFFSGPWPTNQLGQPACNFRARDPSPHVQSAWRLGGLGAGIFAVTLVRALRTSIPARAGQPRSRKDMR